MKLQNMAVAVLLVFATCAEGTEPESSPTARSGKAALGTIPPSEVAVWQKVGSSNSPGSRYLQAAAFDEARQVLVMFGGISGDPSWGTVTLNDDTWEWNPATGKWTNRTLAGAKPGARSGAAMVYDSIRAKLILFGGRAGSGFNLEDTWEWDPTTGGWTEMGTAGHPSARSQHSMVFEKSTGKALLFGGGRSAPTSADGSGVTISLGDTWEYDPATQAWTERTVSSAPSVRHDSAMVWDSSRDKVVLFGGLQTDIAEASGVPKQDTWEWDPVAGTWSQRTAAGSKPSQRYGHAMAFDGIGKQLMLFGGWDIGTGLGKNDLWAWEPTTGAWTQRLTSGEAGLPTGRMYASMIADDARNRTLIVAGAMVSGVSGIGGTGGKYYPDAGVMADMVFLPIPSREIWELDPVTAAFANRTPPLDAPTARYSPAVAWNPISGKTCLFGGSDYYSGQMLDDYWEWDGKTWTQRTPTGNWPPARAYAAMAYDPARKSMILYGGAAYSFPGSYQDTWELTAAGTWTELHPTGSPGGLMGHGMVTDTTRNRILLFGGMPDTFSTGPVFLPTPGQNWVWEWDGEKATWTDRTPLATTNVPLGREYPALAYDEGRRKLFLFDGATYGTSFSEWDPISGGWAVRETGEFLYGSYDSVVAYDSVRRRIIVLPGVSSMSSTRETWELDTVGPTWYVRTTSTAPWSTFGSAMVFDSKRGVVVFVGGPNYGSFTGDNPIETWEYQVTSWGNGEGCTAATASQCASGFCVDGVCCEVAGCTGACQSCNVPGSEGACVLAEAGTEVAGSCDSGKACDGSGSCKAKNGLACTGSADCASGFCADGVCCDSACTGPCVSCNQAGRVGQCASYQAGTDPENECGQGDGVCKSVCDGAGHCAFPQYQVSCGECLACDGAGYCTSYDYYRCGIIVRPPYDGGPYPIIDGGPYPIVFDAPPDVLRGTGGQGGGTGRGGAGGTPGIDGGPRGYGGGPARLDGAAGNVSRSDGSAGSIPSLGGAVAGFAGGGVPGAGGSTGKPGSNGDGAVTDGSAKADLHKSGCSCALGSSRSSAPGVGLCLIAAALAPLLVRQRSRQRPRRARRPPGTSP